jgi:hypothetical protein
MEKYQQATLLFLANLLRQRQTWLSAKCRRLLKVEARVPSVSIHFNCMEQNMAQNSCCVIETNIIKLSMDTI